MQPKKLPKRLFKNQEVIHAYQHDRSAKSRLKQMPRDHPDVLHAIESAVVGCARQERGVDDLAIHQALRTCIEGTELPERAGVSTALVYTHLVGLRDSREDVPETVWVAGLRTVDESVRRHSNLSPGETSYLDFVRPYVC
jgi:hypothetical protein